MSAEYEGQDPIAIAQQAERDLNSNAAKTGASTESSGNRRGANASDSSTFPRSPIVCNGIDCVWTRADPVLISQQTNPASTKTSRANSQARP